MRFAWPVSRWRVFRCDGWQHSIFFPPWISPDKHDEGDLDFAKASLLKELPREARAVRHNFPKLGILCLRFPLPSTVLLQEHEELCAAFVIGDTRSALGFDQTIVFRPDFSVELPGRLQDGRIVDRCVFGWPAVLAPEGGPQMDKTISASGDRS